MRFCADDDGLDAALAHERAAHVVAEDRGLDAVFHEFPRGEASALQKGAGLIGEHVDFKTALNRGTDDAEGGAITASGQRSGVAVG